MEDVENQSKPRGNPFSIEDLLDLPNEDPGMFASGEYENSHEPVPEFSCTDSSTVATLDTCINSVLHASETHFSGELICYGVADGDLSSEIGAPYGDLTDLEWLSNFVEESFSSEDIQNPNPLTSVPKSDSSSTDTQLFFHREPPVPGKARSKRSRTIPCNWSSLLSSSQEIFPAGKKPSPAITGVRKCMHCETEKTPQWRMGPLGPKTLCNACGVRFKSGRLVPEYRPAASPLFVVSKHSNSHRKVVELRRKSELQKSMFGGVAAGFTGEDLLIRRGFGED